MDRKRGLRPSSIVGIPFLPLFCVVVGYVGDAGQVHVFHYRPPDFFGLHPFATTSSGGVFVSQHRTMHRRMTPPAQGNKVHRMIYPTAPTRYYVMNLQPLRIIAQGASPSIPAVDLAPHVPGNSRVHCVSFSCHIAPSFPPFGTCLQTHEGKGEVAGGHVSGQQQPSSTAGHQGRKHPCAV